MTTAELKRSKVTGVSFLGLLHQIIFRSIHGTYVDHTLSHPCYHKPIAFVKLCKKKKEWDCSG